MRGRCWWAAPRRPPWRAFPCAERRVPPRDLERALPQQALILVAAREALGTAAPAGGDRTGVIIGMRCDAEIARHGARRRLGDWAARWREAGLPASPAWLSAAREGVGPAADAEAVLGLLPNVVANRVNQQWAFGGPGFTVSAKEGSGLRALHLAAAALRAGELDAKVRAMERAVPVLPADDLRVAKAFYVDGLGFRVTFAATEDGKNGLLGLERGTIAVTIDCPMSGHGREACVSLQVDSADRYYLAWRERVAIRRPPRDEPWGARTFDLIDPFGNTIFVIGPPA